MQNAFDQINKKSQVQNIQRFAQQNLLCAAFAHMTLSCDKKRTQRYPQNEAYNLNAKQFPRLNFRLRFCLKICFASVDDV